MRCLVDERHDLVLMGYYTSHIGPLNQVLHLWRYDSLAEMERKRTAGAATRTGAGSRLERRHGTGAGQQDHAPTSFSPIA